MDKLLFTCNSILPIILPILLGYFLKRINFFKDGFLEGANKLVFKILIPLLLFSNIYLADISKINWLFVGFAAIAILILFFIGMFIVTFIKDRKQKGVILLATFRSNYAIIGIPLATMLGGAQAAMEASIVAAITVPIFNILAVIALTIYDHDENTKVSVKDILKKIVQNPLIIGVFFGLVGCAINMIVTACGGNLKEFLNDYVTFIPKTISSIAGITTPLALLVLGAKFEFRAVNRLWKQLSVSVILRLFITPAIFLTIAYFLGFNTSTYFAILIALFATPIAVSSAPMAAQMGQDEELAGQIVVWTSTVSAISLFIIIFICAQLGIF